MMTRLVKTLFFLGIALLLTGLIAPGFINWNKHKSALMAQISPYFQREIRVGGNISFQILPQPELLLENVTVANADGSMKNPLMTLKSLEAQVSLAPLLQGRIVVNTVNLIKPVFNIDVYDSGKTNFSGLLAPSDNLEATAEATRLDQISITDGTVHYANFLTGARKTFDNLTLTVSADTLLGPYHISGNMVYQQTNANLQIDTGLFDSTMTAPIKLSFMPVENLPQINVNGTISLQDGVNLAGGLTISNGKLASLADIPSLNALDFWNTDVNLSGVMVFKGDRFSIHGLDADFGQDGHLRGRISAQVPRRGVRNIEADLSGDGLAVTAKPFASYPEIPDGYKINLVFKGKKITWGGKILKTADISASSKNKNWLISSAQITLDGNSTLGFSGTVMPQMDSAIYQQFHITTDDLGKMAGVFTPNASSVFSMLDGENAPFKKMRMDGSLQISPDKISFYNINATLNGKERISGALNVLRKAKEPTFTAKLHLDGWNSADFPDAFLKSLLSSNATLKLTADHFVKDGLALSGITFNGEAGAKGLTIESLDGNLSEKDKFSITGQVASLAPVSGLAIAYTLTTAHDAAKIAKALGAALPPLLGDNVSLQGTVKQTPAGAYAYTATGRADHLTLQGQTIDHPSFMLDAPTPSAVSISKLTGKIWDGMLQGRLDFTAGKQPATWASTFKGTVKKADLSALQKQLGFKGFAVGQGDIGFDLASSDNTLRNATGDISLRTDKLTIDDFNAEKLPAALRKLEKMPKDLLQTVSDAVHHGGASVFKNAAGKFNLDHGKISIADLTLINTAEKMTLTGTADMVKHDYAISGALQLPEPKDFPVLAVSRSSQDKDYKISDEKALHDYVLKHLPAPKKPKKPAAVPKQKDQPINDILNRLKESDKATAKDKPAATQPPLVKPKNDLTGTPASSAQ